MSYCSECGHNNSDVSKFCANCGTSIEALATTAPKPKNNKVTQKSKQVKSGVWQSVYYCLFEDNDPHSVSKNLLILIATNFGISIALEQILWPKTADSLDLGFMLILSAVVYGVLFLLIKLATKKHSVIWLYPILALYAFAVFSSFDQDSQQKISFLLGGHPQWGTITRLWTLALGLWDLILGTIVEAVLIIRLYILIRTSR